MSTLQSVSSISTRIMTALAEAGRDVHPEGPVIALGTEPLPQSIAPGTIAVRALPDLVIAEREPCCRLRFGPITEPPPPAFLEVHVRIAVHLVQLLAADDRDLRTLRVDLPGVVLTSETPCPHRRGRS